MIAHIPTSHDCNARADGWKRPPPIKPDASLIDSSPVFVAPLTPNSGVDGEFLDDAFTSPSDPVVIQTPTEEAPARRVKQEHAVQLLCESSGPAADLPRDQVALTSPRLSVDGPQAGGFPGASPELALSLPSPGAGGASLRLGRNSSLGFGALGGLPLGVGMPSAASLEGPLPITVTVAAEGPAGASEFYSQDLDPWFRPAGEWNQGCNPVGTLEDDVWKMGRLSGSGARAGAGAGAVDGEAGSKRKVAEGDGGGKARSPSKRQRTASAKGASAPPSPQSPKNGPPTPEQSGEREGGAVAMDVAEGGTPAVASRAPAAAAGAAGPAASSVLRSVHAAPGTAGGAGGGEKKKRSRKRRHVPRCFNCGVHSTPQWRCGPHGPKTLCNACGVRHKKGLPLEPNDAGIKALHVHLARAAAAAAKAAAKA